MIGLIFAIWLIAIIVMFFSGLVLAFSLLLKVGEVAFILLICWVIYKVIRDRFE